MSFENAPVTHKRYGAGKVLSLKDNALTILFKQYGTHTLRFPDVFETVLQTSDESLANYASESLLHKKRCEE